MAKKTTSKTDKSSKDDLTEAKIADTDVASETSMSEDATNETSDLSKSADTLDEAATDADAPDELASAEPESDTSDTTSVEEAEKTDTLTPEEQETLASDAEVMDDKASETADESDALIDEVPEKAEDPEPVADPAPLAASNSPTPERPSAMPMVLGGVAAGAIGFAAAFFGLAQQPDARGDALRGQISEIGETLDTQSGALASLTEQVESLADGPDLAPIASQIEGFTDAIAGLSERVVASETQLESLDERLRQMEQRPVTDNASEAAIAAYEQELEAARSEIATQRAELEALIENALASENDAEGAAKAAMTRAAVSRILSAIDSGTGFPNAVADLQSVGVEVPPSLADVSEAGVPSLTALQDGFPDAARAALAAARSVGDENGGFSSFWRTQLGARSLEPREGNDPDAILSRAEAALHEGRLTDVMGELDALPEEGKAELSAWIDEATRRMNAMSAAQSLSETVN